jgi:nucleoside diphosphate kinase
MERTFIMVKPDGVQRGLVAEIIARFERKGYKLVAMKMCKPERSHFEVHYQWQAKVSSQFLMGNQDIFKKCLSCSHGFFYSTK